MTPLSLRALKRLCTTYVPRKSRHPGSLHDRPSPWWPAHEIGHLLTVPPEWIGMPMFGIPVGIPMRDDLDSAIIHLARCYELAAMSVSRRLLTGAGEARLFRLELEETDHLTVAYEDRGDVQRILRTRNCLRLPRHEELLESRLRQVVRQAVR